MKYRCVIFDCDGTLVDTLEDIAGAMNASLAAHGFPAAPIEKYRDMTGWGVFKLASLALPEDVRTEETIRTVSLYTVHLMEEQIEYRSRPYPGISALLAELKAKKFSLGVLSNKSDAALRLLIDKLFGPTTFDAVYGLRPHVPPKPDPTALWEMTMALDRIPSDTVFVGDSEIDMETARGAGCYPLGVSWGFRPRSVLEEAGAASIIDTPEEIWEIIGRK